MEYIRLPSHYSNTSRSGFKNARLSRDAQKTTRVRQRDRWRSDRVPALSFRHGGNAAQRLQDTGVGAACTCADPRISCILACVGRTRLDPWRNAAADLISGHQRRYQAWRFADTDTDSSIVPPMMRTLRDRGKIGTKYPIINFRLYILCKVRRLDRCLAGKIANLGVFDRAC
jgi:hypothetical protein